MKKNKLAEHFLAKRKELGLTRGQLAGMVGYSNISKGAGKIFAFETTGRIHFVLLSKLTVAMNIDPGVVDDLVIEIDRREFFKRWVKWVNTPITPYLVVRLSAAVNSDHELPEDIKSIEAAETYASEFAREKGLRCCLEWTRRLSIWFDRDGRVERVTEAAPGEPNEPFVIAE